MVSGVLDEPAIIVHHSQESLQFLDSSGRWDLGDGLHTLGKRSDAGARHPVAQEVE